MEEDTQRSSSVTSKDLQSVQRLQNSTGLIKMANNFSLGVNEDDIEEQLEVVAKSVGTGTGMHW